MAGIVVAFGGIVATLFVTLALAARLDRVWKLLRRAAGHDQREGMLARIFGATAIVALVIFSFWFLIIKGPAPTALMRRFLDYYRQFDALTPEEISRELRRAAGHRARHLRRARPLERRLAGRAGSRRSSTPPPSRCAARSTATRTRRALRAAIAAAHGGIEPARVVVGHGAGELLRSLLGALAARRLGGAGVAGLAPAAGADLRGGRDAGPARPAPPGSSTGRLRAAGPPPALSGVRTGRRVTVLARPADPTGAVVRLDEVQAVAERLGPHEWLVLDEALAGFLPDGEDELVDHPRVVHVRSFSKVHAMAGFRVGYAVLPDSALARAPGAGARRRRPGARRGAVVRRQRRPRRPPRRRARAAALRAQLARALAGGDVEMASGVGPYVWLTHPGAPPLAERLAAQRVFAAPGSAWGDDASVRVTLRDVESTDRLAAALSGGEQRRARRTRSGSRRSRSARPGRAAARSAPPR